MAECDATVPTTPAPGLPPPASSSSRQWSGEIRIGHFVDLQATAMAVSSSSSSSSNGRFVLLGGKKQMALVDLEGGGEHNNNDKRMLEVCHRLPRPPADPIVSKVLFDPSASSNSAAVISGDKVDMVEVGEANISLDQYFRPHSRYVTDMDWNVQNPKSLATCSNDSYVHVWDTRDLSQASLTFQSSTSSNQIRWNPTDGNQLLGVYDGDLRLWDIRRPSVPVRFLTAHRSSTVLSIDWCTPASNNSSPSNSWILTSGLDCALKVFDASGDMKEPTGMLKTSVPVWKAKWVPFGHGFATVILPQLKAYNDNSLFLWNTFRLDFPVHCFYGHMDVILDFDWRRLPNGNFQMVSWARDQSLRVWSVDNAIQSKCRPFLNADASLSNSSADEGEAKDEYDDEARVEADEASDEDMRIIGEGMNIIDVGGDTLTSSSGSALLIKDTTVGSDDVFTDDSAPKVTVIVGSIKEEGEDSPADKFANTLQKEFEDFPDRITGGRMRVEKLDWTRRKCKFSVFFSTAKHAEQRIGLAINFPILYPDKAAPTFALAKGSTLYSVHKKKLMKLLKLESKRRTDEGLPCIEACIRQLEEFLAEIKLEDAKEDDDPAFPLMGADPGNVLESGSVLFGDINVPYPRTSGASFCGNGKLVCFGRVQQQPFLLAPDGTPRTLATFNTQQVSDPHLRQSPMATITAVASTSSLIGVGEDIKSKKKLDNNTLKKKGRFNIKKVATGSGDLSAATRKASWPGPIRSTRLSNELRQEKPSKIVVYDVSRLFPFSKAIAKQYVLNRKAPEQACHTNASLAFVAGMKERSRMWSVAACVGKLVEEVRYSLQDDDENPLHNHAHGKKLLSSLISHLMKQGDVQMAAVLICNFMPTASPKQPPTLRPVLKRLPLPTPSPPLEASPKSEANLGKRGKGRRKNTTISPKIKISSGSSPSPTGVPSTPPPSTEKKQKFWFLGSGPSPLLDENNDSHNSYHTVNLGTIAASRRTPRAEAIFSSSFVKSDHSMEHFVTPYFRVSRSNSWTAEELQLTLSPAIVSEEAFEDDTLSTAKNQPRLKFNVLGDDFETLETVLRAYAGILDRWGLIQERASLLKHSTDYSHAEGKIQPMSSLCSKCGERGCGGVQCAACGAVCLRCAVCTLPVKGMARSCTKCGHGGHFSHWTNWFVTLGGETCPKAGCRCNCFTK